MQNLWATGAASLLEVLTEVRGVPRDEMLASLYSHPRASRRPSWPGVLARIRGIEAALLQDVKWWGPAMEERLYRWSDEEGPSGRRDTEAHCE